MSGGRTGETDASVASGGSGRSGGKISSSMMCADFMNLERDIRTLEKHGVELLHIDVMDGNFVPNFTLGTDFVRKLKEAAKIPVDVHLMVDRPEDKIDWFEIGEGDYVSFHCEATKHAYKALQRFADRGAKALVALNPATPLCALDELIREADGALIMAVNPGFAGQRLISGALDKIRRLRDLYPDIEIEVDGNVSFENAVLMRAAGADIFVAGTSSIFSKGGSLDENIMKFRECIK